MTRILLADDSPHAQRMGERILREEGFEVVSVTDGETAMLRLADVDPDVVIADIFLPQRSGYDICRYIKSTPRHSHTRVVLTAGLLEPFDQEQARAAHYDQILKKPFEASAMVEMVKLLATASQAARVGKPASTAPEPPQSPVVSTPEPTHISPVSDPRRSSLRGLFERKPTVIRVVPDLDPLPAAPPPEPKPEPKLEPEPEPKPAPKPLPQTGGTADSAIERYARQFLSKSAPAQPDPERVRAAVTLALDAVMPELIEAITRRVLTALERDSST